MKIERVRQRGYEEGHRTVDDVTALRMHAMPLVGADPALPEDDLLPLLRHLEGAHLVGLGEATHGDHESFVCKVRLIQALVRRNRCDVVIFERNAAELDAYDRYVTGASDTLPPMGEELYPWQVEEARDLFQWLRAWNQSGGKVRLAGMDMQSPAGLPLAVRLLDEAGIAAPDAWRRLAQDVDDHQNDLAWLESALRTWRSNPAPPLDQADAQQRWIALLVATFEQWLEYWPLVRRQDDAAWPIRRRALPANALAQLARFGPTTTGVIWAHNGHVSLDGDGAENGALLRQRLGYAYRSVCFAFGTGAFNAGNVPVDSETGKPGRIDWTLRPHPAQEPPEGSLEDVLGTGDLDCYAIRADALPALKQERAIRSVGAALAGGPAQFNYRCVPAEAFDLLVYFRIVQPSRPLAAS